MIDHNWSFSCYHPSPWLHIGQTDTLMHWYMFFICLLWTEFVCPWICFFRLGYFLPDADRASCALAQFNSDWNTALSGKTGHWDWADTRTVWQPWGKVWMYANSQTFPTLSDVEFTQTTKYKLVMSSQCPGKIGPQLIRGCLISDLKGRILLMPWMFNNIQSPNWNHFLSLSCGTGESCWQEKTQSRGCCGLHRHGINCDSPCKSLQDASQCSNGQLLCRFPCFVRWFLVTRWLTIAPCHTSIWCEWGTASSYAMHVQSEK